MYNVSLPWWAYALMGAGLMLFLGLLTVSVKRNHGVKRSLFASPYILWMILFTLLPCVLIAYLRPFLVNLLIRQEGAEQSYGAPSINSMGWAPYMVLVVVLTLVHHGYLVFLEWLSFGNFWYFLGKVGASTAISLLLILITEMLFYRKERFRTNM